MQSLSLSYFVRATRSQHICSFWLLVCALRDFAAAHNGRPPLSGASARLLPRIIYTRTHTPHTHHLRAHARTSHDHPPLGRVLDQPSSSANFVALLNVFRSKRDTHVAWLLDAANRHAQRCGAHAVTPEEAKDMVEFSSFTLAFTGTSLEQEFGAACVGPSTHRAPTPPPLSHACPLHP